MIRRLVIHPFLLCLYPIVALYSNNVYETKPTDLIGPIALGLAATAGLWGLMSLLLWDPRKGGLIASILIVLFFGIYRLVDFTAASVLYLSSFWITYTEPVAPSYTYAGAGVITLVACYLVIGKLKDPASMTAVVNVFSIILLAIPLSNIFIVRPPISTQPGSTWKPRPLANLPEPAARPDIYYLILDSYARWDVMKALFDIDNGPFLDRLEKKGFYIARHATANYCQTRLCLSCSLNCDYLDEMVKGFNNDHTELASLIGRNNVIETLRPLGYKYVSFSSGFNETDHPESDLHLSPSRLPFTGFQRLLVNTTPLASILPEPKVFDRFEAIRKRVLYKLDHLPDIADDPASTFTFAHFMCPHPPFLFGPDGEDIRYREYAGSEHEDRQYDGRPNDKMAYYRGFRDQVTFITKRIEQTIDLILAKSKTPPIIILQSDHGSGLNLDIASAERSDIPERMTILNAYYFPDRRYENLYDSISPVNSFRVVLDTFFGAKLGLLPDKSYFSTWSAQYEFIDVTSQVAGKEYPRAARVPEVPATVPNNTSR